MNHNKTISVIYYANNIIFILFINLLSLIFANAYAKETIIWQSNYDYVSIVSIDDSADKNDHPTKFSTQDIYEILRSIRLTEVDEGFFDIDVFNIFSDDNNADNVNDSRGFAVPHDALFNKNELRKISAPIAKALANSQPDEDIIFSISGKHGGTFGKSELSTTARLFYKNKQLNIIFGEVYVDIQKKYRKSGGTSDVPAQVDSKNLKNFRLNIGLRNNRADLPIEFITDNSHFIGSYKGKRRKDWLKVDLPVLLSELNKNKKNKQRKENIVEETNQLQQQTVEIDKEQEKLKQKVENLERLIQAREKSENQPAAKITPIKTNKSLEEKLSELKQLHEKEIISDDIYNEKVRKLLDEL